MGLLKTIAILGFITAEFFGNCTVASAEKLRIGGTGTATAMLPQLFAASDHTEQDAMEVISGLGTRGALLALADGALDVAGSSRPLTKEERAQGLTQTVAFRTPFVLVTSHPHPNGLKSTEVADVFGGRKAAWADGTPVRLILRPKLEADMTLFAGSFPGAAAAIEQARRRAEIPVTATDQDNAALAEQLPGSLALATLGQVKAEQRNLRMVSIDEVPPTLANFERGTYPLAKTVYVILPATKSAAAERFVAFLRSPAGVTALRVAGSLPSAD